MFKRTRAMVVFALVQALLANVALAVLPENGLYSDPEQSGKAFYIEVQNGIAVLVLYAGSPEDGTPQYFTAAAPLISTNLFETPLDFIGFYPVPGFTAPLYRLSHAPCLTCHDLSFSASANNVLVGDVDVAFGDRNRALVVVYWSGQLGPGARNGQAYQLLRYDYGYPLQKDVNGADLIGNVALLGEWVFVDETDVDRAPWRFQFTTAVTGTDSQYDGVRPSTDFSDPKHNAVAHCVAYVGCQVSQNGSPIFSMRYTDIGNQSLVAYLGTFIYAGTGVYRGTQLVMGYRVEKQPQSLPPGGS